MVAKAAGGILGIGLIGTGGIAMTKPHWLGMDYMPNFHTLSEDKNFSSNSPYGSDTFGKKYGRYLVGVNSKNESGNAPEKTNEDWWEWALRRLRKTTKPKKFEQVDKGYGTTENQHLSQVCKAAYGTNDSTGFGTDNDKFSKDDVWKYCSPGKLKTTSEDEGTHDTNKIGWDNTNKTTLVSVKDSSNDWFWEIRNKDFWDNENSEWSGKNATTGSGSNKSLFKEAYDNKNTTPNPPIKELCRKTYEQPTNSTQNNTDAKKFCELEGSTT